LYIIINVYGDKKIFIEYFSWKLWFINMYFILPMTYENKNFKSEFLKEFNVIGKFSIYISFNWSTIVLNNIVVIVIIFKSVLFYYMYYLIIDIVINYWQYFFFLQINECLKKYFIVFNSNGISHWCIYDLLNYFVLPISPFFDYSIKLKFKISNLFKF